MAMFPIFIDIKGKECLVVGGGRVAERKIETLLKFGSRIKVVSPDISEGIEGLELQSKLIVNRREYSGDDMENACLVIAATDDAAVNDRICKDAGTKGIPVNVVDAPEKCTFVFPSVVVREDLVIGISTSGSFPAMSKKIRERLEAAVPEAYGEIVGFLRDWRARAEKEIKDADARKELLNRILEEILSCGSGVNDRSILQKIEEIYKEYTSLEQRSS